MRRLLSLFFFSLVILAFPISTLAQDETTSEATPAAAQEISPTTLPTLTPEPALRPDITQPTEAAVGPLEELLLNQELGPMFPFNPLKYAIRSAVDAGVPPNTIVLLLLLPVVAALIATARHIVGLRGFGIFLPAALSVVFVAIGPIVGLLLFLVIIVFSIVIRKVLILTKSRLQYLPRMALILWFVVLGVLAVLSAAPWLTIPGLTSISIFPVLILVLLSEDFTRVQLGKSARTAINLTTETLILALISYVLLSWQALQKFTLLNPEGLLVAILIFDFIVGKFVGLRLREYWRFRKLLTG